MSSGKITGHGEWVPRLTSGRAPTHRMRNGVETWEYGPKGPDRVADAYEIARAVRGMTGSRHQRVRLGIVGTLAAPWVYTRRNGQTASLPAQQTMYQPVEVYRDDLLLALASYDTLAEALAEESGMEWDDVYTVYVQEYVP